GEVEALAEQRAIHDDIDLPVREAKESRPSILLRRLAIERDRNDTLSPELRGQPFGAFPRSSEGDRALPGRVLLPLLHRVLQDGLALHNLFDFGLNVITAARVNAIHEIDTGRSESPICREVAAIDQPAHRWTHDHGLPDR